MSLWLMQLVAIGPPEVLQPDHRVQDERRTPGRQVRPFRSAGSAADLCTFLRGVGNSDTEESSGERSDKN